MSIDYPASKKLALWVRDDGDFDSYQIYLNGQLFDTVGDQTTQRYPITRPDKVETIVIHFGGNDGGSSAIVDVTDDKARTVVEKQTGMNHSYILNPV